MKARSKTKAKTKTKTKTKTNTKTKIRANPATTRPLYTIGYEQAKPAGVLDELKRAKIGLLVDTRAVAASRRPGFSKRQLAASLDEIGIDYIHLQKLGTPVEGRIAARSGDTGTLWRIYDKHIRTPGARAELDELIALIKSGRRVALLCYCRDPKTCHRSRIVANVKKRTPVKVDDLIPPLF
ncbi:MAG TPA: DUF488 domain-containing protein [Pseudolabrys sp.]|jgi:uncharacterized protein (DUF488 family)|nr:DUF488 domain-containing protein [Pseudolabrys sp.]